MTTFDVRRVLDPIISHGKALGRLDVVTGHEPKSAPRGKLSAAVWVQSTDPVTSSGLNSSSIRIVVQARIYASMTSEPQDAIDPDMTNAAIEWVARLNGDLDLGGAARTIDVRAIHGVGLGAQAGYIEQDGRLFRVYTLTIPVLVNDVWTESA